MNGALPGGADAPQGKAHRLLHLIPASVIPEPAAQVPVQQVDSALAVPPQGFCSFRGVVGQAAPAQSLPQDPAALGQLAEPEGRAAPRSQAMPSGRGALIGGAFVWVFQMSSALGPATKFKSMIGSASQSQVTSEHRRRPLDQELVLRRLQQRIEHRPRLPENDEGFRREL